MLPKTWAQRLRDYDQHNPFCRSSDDPMLRMFGKCGCRNCADTRKRWAELPAPIDQQGREGSNSMAGINICDREGCGALVNGRALGAVQIRTSADYDTQETVSKELCPACIAETLALLESPCSEPRERAYRDPYTRKPDAPTEPTVDINALIQRAVDQRLREIEG